MATYHELKALLADLARQAEEAKALEVHAVIDEIRAKVAEYGLTEQDIFGRRRRAQVKRGFVGVPNIATLRRALNGRDMAGRPPGLRP